VQYAGALGRAVKGGEGAGGWEEGEGRGWPMGFVMVRCHLLTYTSMAADVDRRHYVTVITTSSSSSSDGDIPVVVVVVVRDDNGSAGHRSSGSTNLSGSRGSHGSVLVTRDPVNKIPRTGYFVAVMTFDFESTST